MPGVWSTGVPFPKHSGVDLTGVPPENAGAMPGFAAPLLGEAGPAIAWRRQRRGHPGPTGLRATERPRVPPGLPGWRPRQGPVENDCPEPHGFAGHVHSLLPTGGTACASALHRPGVRHCAVQTLPEISPTQRPCVPAQTVLPPSGTGIRAVPYAWRALSATGASAAPAAEYSPKQTGHAWPDAESRNCPPTATKTDSATGPPGGVAKTS